jgi:hypothetical protein
MTSLGIEQAKELYVEEDNADSCLQDSAHMKFKAKHLAEHILQERHCSNYNQLSVLALVLNSNEADLLVTIFPVWAICRLHMVSPKPTPKDNTTQDSESTRLRTRA